VNKSAATLFGQRAILAIPASAEGLLLVAGLLLLHSSLRDKSRSLQLSAMCSWEAHFAQNRVLGVAANTTVLNVSGESARAAYECVSLHVSHG
jgi:hypothetical protein